MKFDEDSFEHPTIQLDFPLKLSVLGLEDDPEFGITDYDGHITIYNEHAGHHVKIGKVRAFVLDLSDAQSCLWDLLDTTQVLSQYMPLAGAKGRSFIPAVYNKMDVSDASRVLVLDWCELLPVARGQGIGLKVLERLCDTIGRGCDVGIMKPWPLQFRRQQTGIPEIDERPEEPDEWRDSMGYDKMSQDEKVSLKKLVDQYGKLGFHNVTVDGEVFMVRDLFFR